MATTIIEVLAAADSTEVTLTSRGGTTGTASNPYELTRIAGKLCTISVDEALTGDWVASDGEIETGINDLVDQAITVRLGNVPTATEISDRIERSGGPLDLLVPATLTGPNAVLVTVLNDDDNAPIENALVRIYRSGFSESRYTDSVGRINSFAVDSATWNFAVSAGGFVSKVVEQVISDEVNQSHAYTIRLVPNDGGVYSSAGWIG